MSKTKECPDPVCDGFIMQVTDSYGHDADGRRGVTVYRYECSECGEDPEMYEEVI